MQRWNLREIDMPDGSRSPVVLHSEEGVARAVLIGLQPGQALGDHEVKERAFVNVVEGSVRVEAGGESVEAGVGELFAFDPEERHSLSSEGGARVLLVLAPWPGAGHFRGEAAD
jgi:quercetin dioxygenase-like cupin family protein